MKLGEPYKKLFELDSVAFLKKLEQAAKSNNSHPDTIPNKSLCLVTGDRTYPLESTINPNFELFEEELKEFLDKIKNYYNFSNLGINKMFVTDLEPGGYIDEHYDNGECYKFTHRVHWCLKTSPGVDFIISGKSVPFQINDVIEICNTEECIHSVVNNTKINRIHLIIDVYDINNTKGN